MEVMDPHNPSYERFRANPSAIESQPDLMAEEGVMFAKMLESYIGCLFSGNSKGSSFPDGGKNRWAGVDPGFIMYDVSVVVKGGRVLTILRLSTRVYRTSQQRCAQI
jgi:hypothetical protein